jgi:hypothetical protein
MQSICTLRVDKPYEGMQQYLNVTTHPPNAVIASQLSTQASFLSPNEYVAFGQLRSGNRIQIRNIVRALIGNSLSFAEPSVYSLMMQTIYQAEPEGDNPIFREAHVDLMDQQFGEELLQELHGRMDALGDNWKESLALAVLITLATRLHSITTHSSIATKALSCLTDARALALKWLDAALAEESSMSTVGSADTQHRSAQIGAIYRSTFDLDSQTVCNLLKTPENLVNYIFASTPIANYARKLGNMPHGHQLLFRRDEQLSYRIESYVFGAVKQYPSTLNLIAKRSWNGFHPGTSWSHLGAPGERWWKCITASDANRRPRHVYVNILDGTILVDGSPLGHLPTSYVNHPTYKELFGSSVSSMLEYYVLDLTDLFRRYPSLVHPLCSAWNTRFPMEIYKFVFQFPILYFCLQSI